MKAVHVIAGLDRHYGGPSESVPRLCAGLAALGIRVELHSVAGHRTIETSEPGQWRGSRRFPWDYEGVPGLRRFRASRALAKALLSEAAETDVFHNHGLWLMPNVYAGAVSSRVRRPLVVSPRGMFAGRALSLSRHKKRLFWWAVQGPAFSRVACYHATAEAEYHDIRAFGIRTPVAVIPNGVDLPLARVIPCTSGAKTLLFLGRLHPIKALSNLLRAWAQIEPGVADWCLRIIGPDDVGHGAELRAEIQQLRLQRVSIEDPLYGDERTKLFNEVSLCILPSHSENFGMAAAEALAAGLPLIAGRGTPWSGVIAERCGWWVENDAASLSRAIAEATALPEGELAAMGARGQAWVARKFSWDSVAARTFHLYDWVLGRGAKPEFVHVQ
jgi:glycosyltransferase involved in cell wall biosynthesis